MELLNFTYSQASVAHQGEGQLLEYDGTKDAQWFRKTGPLAVDFEMGAVCECADLLAELGSSVLSNQIFLLCGEAGTGKTVLACNLAYRLQECENGSDIYYYTCKSSDFGVRALAADLGKIDGIIIIEDGPGYGM